MSNDGITEIIIETALPPKRKVPEVLNVPELPLDAPDYDTFVAQLDNTNQRKTDDRSTDPTATNHRP